MSLHSIEKIQQQGYLSLNALNEILKFLDEKDTEDCLILIYLTKDNYKIDTTHIIDNNEWLAIADTYIDDELTYAEISISSSDSLKSTINKIEDEIDYLIGRIIDNEKIKCISIIDSKQSNIYVAKDIELYYVDTLISPFFIVSFGDNPFKVAPIEEVKQLLVKQKESFQGYTLEAIHILLKYFNQSDFM